MSIIETIIKFLAKLGSSFGKLVKGAEKVYSKADPAIQTAVRDANTFVKILNENPDKTAEFLIGEIRRFAPGFDAEGKIEGAIEEIWKDFNLAGADVKDHKTILVAIQTYLNSIKGTSKWAKQSELIAGTIALYLAPGGTFWNKIGTIVWYVFQRYVK